MPTALVTGANRGIGFGLARALLDRGYEVIATCRDAANAEDLQRLKDEQPLLRIEELDVRAFTSIDALAERLGQLPIDLLVNIAAIIGHDRPFGSLDYEEWQDVLSTNLLGPVRLSERLLDNLVAGSRKQLVTISSGMGSIGTARDDFIAYRTSKAALNMAMRVLAANLRDQGITVGLITPGVVATEMSSTLDKPKISVEVSVRGILKVIESLSLQDSGTFIRYNGEPVSW